MDEEERDFFELAAGGEVEDVVAAVVQVVAALADGADAGIAGDHAGEGDGFFCLEKTRRCGLAHRSCVPTLLVLGFLGRKQCVEFFLIGMVVEHFVEFRAGLHQVEDGLLGAVLADGFVDGGGGLAHGAKGAEGVEREADAGGAEFFEGEQGGLAELGEVGEDGDGVEGGGEGAVFVGGGEGLGEDRSALHLFLFDFIYFLFEIYEDLKNYILYNRLIGVFGFPAFEGNGSFAPGIIIAYRLF